MTVRQWKFERFKQIGGSQASLLLALLAGLGVVGLLGVAVWLRWRYIHNVNLHVDEFVTLWAARRVLETGAPISAEGAVYARGLVSSYLTAAFYALGGVSSFVGRLPSLVFGVSSVLAVFVIGWRSWGAPVGWLAAVGLTLLPEAIVASGRARFYAPLMLFTLLLFWFLYRAMERKTENRDLLLAALFFALAIFTQEETVLLYPIVLAVPLLWGGRRIWRRPAFWWSQMLCLAAILGRASLELHPRFSAFAELQASKPTLTLQLELVEAWGAYGHLFAAPRRVGWTLAAVLAVGAALWALHQRRWRLAALPCFHLATLFYVLPFVWMALLLFTVVGHGYRDSRYILFVQPFWLLTAAAGATWVIRRIVGTKRVWEWVAVLLLTVAAVVALRPLTLNALTQRSDGYEPALAYVAEHMQPGDVAMSPQPPACAFMLGRPCDYYLRQRGYAPYVMASPSGFVDRWTGAELLHTESELAEVIRTAPRVWLVVDADRLASRYNPDLLLTILDQFRVVHKAERSYVLLAEAWRERPDYVAQAALPGPIPVGPLTLQEMFHSAAGPSEYFYSVLFWTQNTPTSAQVNTSLQLVSADGTRLSQADGPPGRGLIPTRDFDDLPIPDRKVMLLPDDLAPGRYRLEVLTYEAATGEPLGGPVPVTWFRLGPPPDTPTQAMDAEWGNGLRLTGTDPLPAELQPGAPLTLRLVWSAAQPVDEDYTVFVHLVGSDGQIVSQIDQVPENGFYPTSRWAQNELVEDHYRLDLPAALPEDGLRLQVGWYLPTTGERLLTTSGSDSVTLATWQTP